PGLIRVSLDLEGVVLHRSHALGELVELLLVFRSQIAAVEAKQDLLVFHGLVVVHVVEVLRYRAGLVDALLRQSLRVLSVLTCLKQFNLLTAVRPSPSISAAKAQRPYPQEKQATEGGNPRPPVGLFSDFL